MNLYQCQEKAKDVGFDSSEFYAMFPCGPVRCKWIDAYMGFLKIYMKGMNDGFLMVKDIDEKYPDLKCSNPINIGTEE